MDTVVPRDLGRHLRRLRAQSGIGLRELSARAELSPAALGTNFADFFASRNDIQVEMVLEIICPQEAQTGWESHSCGMGGFLISGGPLTLEIEGRPAWQLKKGDAYHVKANTRHRAINRGKAPVRQVTVWYPPRY